MIFRHYGNIITMYRKLFIASFIIVPLFFYGLLLLDFSRQQPVPPVVAAGKKIWQQKGCVECHSILGNGGYTAVDLTRVTITNSPAKLRRFLTGRPIMRPSKTKRHTGLSPVETDRVIDFLKYAAKIPTGNWPPQSLQGGQKQ